MTPREPDRFEAKARERAETLFVRVMGTMTSNKCIDLIVAALRREREAALNEAARDAETYCPLNASVSALVLAREIAVHIRALASPAAAPAADEVSDLLGRGHVKHPREGEPGDAETYSSPAPLLPRVLAALEEHARCYPQPNKHDALAAELRAYIAERAATKGEGK